MANWLGQQGLRQAEPRPTPVCCAHVRAPDFADLRVRIAGGQAAIGTPPSHAPNQPRQFTESKIERNTAAARGTHPEAGRPVSGARLRHDCPKRLSPGVIPTNLPELTPPFPLPPWSRLASRTPGHQPVGFYPSRRRASALALPGSKCGQPGKAASMSLRMRGPLRSPSIGAEHRDGRWWGPTCPDCALEGDRAAAILHIACVKINEPRPGPQPPE